MTDFRSGFACFVGRPNAGKSTLTNALVGTKVAITSGRPQTTRHAIRGIVNRPDAQLVLVDTPGLHRPRTLLGQRLNDLVADTLTEVDVVCFCLPADELVGPGDRFIAEQLSRLPKRVPVVAVVTKTDLVAADRERMTKHLLAVDKLGEWAEIVPVSAVADDQVTLLADLLVARLPQGPKFYPDDEISDEAEETLVAELIREAALEGVRDELPHSLAVVVEELTMRPGREPGNELMEIDAVIYVERDSQKGIVIGKGGAHLKSINTRARLQIEKIFGCKVYMEVRVKLAKDWQRDPKQLAKLGF